jgi:branched-chain amino acid transport system ATP-binding protein
MASALAIEGLSLRFGGLQVLDRVSLSVAPGSIVGLMGPNGAGKTSLLNCVSGLYRPESGSVHLFGRRIDGMAAHRIARLGVRRTFQHPVCVGDMTVLENIALGAVQFPDGARGRSHRSRGKGSIVRTRAMELIDLLGIPAAPDAPARELSFGGMRAVDIARAIISGPRVLLVDEPASGLDRSEIAALGPQLARLAGESRIGMILIEHNVPFLASIANSIVVMNAGSVIASGSPEAVRRDPLVVAAYTGDQTGQTHSEETI